jgi:hypothetical protein
LPAVIDLRDGQSAVIVNRPDNGAQARDEPIVKHAQRVGMVPRASRHVHRFGDDQGDTTLARSP